jgi:hypothetical protein
MDIVPVVAVVARVPIVVGREKLPLASLSCALMVFPPLRTTPVAV